MKRTIHNEAKPFITLPIATRSTTGTTTGTTVDRRDGVNNFRLATVVIFVGETGDGEHNFALEVSDDGANWTQAPARFLLGGELSVVAGDADDNQIITREYIGHERFLRVSSTISNVSLSGGTYGAMLLMHDARRTPV